MKKTMILVLIIVLISGCSGKLKDVSNLSVIKVSNSSWIVEKEVYNGTLFYCFYDNYYNKDVCLPFTLDVKVNVIDYDNIKEYQICEIINETIKECRQVERID